MGLIWAEGLSMICTAGEAGCKGFQARSHDGRFAFCSSVLSKALYGPMERTSVWLSKYDVDGCTNAMRRDSVRRSFL